MPSQVKPTNNTTVKLNSIPSKPIVPGNKLNSIIQHMRSATAKPIGIRPLASSNGLGRVSLGTNPQNGLSKHEPRSPIKLSSILSATTLSLKSKAPAPPPVKVAPPPVIPPAKPKVYLDHGDETS